LISIDQGKAKASSKRTTNQGTLCFVKSLPWLVIEIHGSKKYFLSQYLFIAILCAKVSRVKNALKSLNQP